LGRFACFDVELHFLAALDFGPDSVDGWLAAVAARELERRVVVPAETREQRPSPQEALRATMHRYIAWAREHPARFKLVFGAWSVDSPELGAAAHAAQAQLTGIVAAAQDVGALPAGDPVRLASLVRALAHGGADLAAAGHLAPDGKGHAGPEQLIDDLLGYLRLAAEAPPTTHRLTSP